MLLQISSGNGPIECELAVGNFLKALQKEISDLEIINQVKTEHTGCYRSVLISTKTDVSHIQGTIKWMAKSPFRPFYKRKNWFINAICFDEKIKKSFMESEVRFQTFHSGGPGGQNVNKVETGVRAIHEPSGISVSATEARTQHLNRKLAVIRLFELLAHQNLLEKNKAKQTMWMQHNLLERGNPIRTYVGMNFEKYGG